MRARSIVVCLVLAGCAAPTTSVPARTASPSPHPSPVVVPTPSPTATSTPAGTPRPTLSGADLAARVDPGDIHEHLDALQRAADEAGGNRATGTPGFDASVRYVADRLAAAGYAVQTQGFTAGGLPSTNLIVELRGIDDHRPIMVGAHLDSVVAGPGINDNGSGVAALLTIATVARDLPPPLRTIRFAFWGAEEGGPFGSATYVDRLSTEARASIAGYLNFDMLGSPNPVLFVYDEPDAPTGSAELTALIGAQIDRAGFPWAPIDLDRRSDHGPFADAGIPIGGIFSGGRELVTEEQAATFGAIAGEPSDPCSDAPCDTVGNVDLAVLTRHARLIAEIVPSLTSD